MALWIDDLLTRQREWYAMSGDACALLVELWVEAKVSGNNGAFETDRIYRVADHFSIEARDELITNGWLHKDGEGCTSELCLPIGIPGISYMHNVAGRQESSVLSSDRKKSDFVRRRNASLKANHTKHHVKRGIFNPSCPLCAHAESENESEPSE